MVSIKQQLHDLVDEMNEEQVSEALSYFQHLIGEGAISDKILSKPSSDRMSELAASGQSFYSAPAPGLAALAAQQGTKPVTNLDVLLGDFWPDDESVDDFIATIRQWRREDGCA